jgi:hypothetical protein
MTEKEENGEKGFAKIILNALQGGNQLKPTTKFLVNKLFDSKKDF